MSTTPPGDAIQDRRRPMHDLDALEVVGLDNRIGEDAEIEQPHRIEVLIGGEAADVDCICACVGACELGPCAGRITHRLRDALRALSLDLILRYDGYSRR